MKSLQLKVLSVVASALTVLGAVAAPQATAAERNLVAFGDSVLADPDAGSYFAHRYDRSKGVGVDCPTSNNNALITASSTSVRARPIPPSYRQSRTLRIRPSGCRWTWRHAPACSSWI